LSGQVSRQIIYWNDGFDQDVYSVDNGLTTSRFRLVGRGGSTPTCRSDFMMETDIRIGAPSNQVNQIDDYGFSGSGGHAWRGGIRRWHRRRRRLGDRHQDGKLVLDSKHWDKLTVGRLNSATGGISTIDLSNAGVVITSEPGDYQGAFFMRNGLGRFSTSVSWPAQFGGPSSAGPYSSDCFEHATSRRDAVRYDTPAWHGFIVSAAFGKDDFWDAALRYSGEWHGFRVAAGVGYRSYRDREPDVVVLARPTPSSTTPTGGIG
jgi:hypothetical protein